MGFLDTSFRIKSDPNPDGSSVEYSSPQWQDDNLDGQADVQIGERKWPVSYVKSSKARVELKFELDGEIDETTSIKVKGNGTDVNFPESEIVYNAVYHWWETTILSTLSFKPSVHHYDNLDISWMYQVDGGSWQTLGTTSNDVYLTLNPASWHESVFHTAVYIGSEKGKGATDEDQLIDKVWAYFSGKHVQTVNETDIRPNGQPSTPLTYWKNWRNSSSGIHSFLQNHDGRCAQWQQFFTYVFDVQGFTDVRNVTVNSNDPTHPALIMNNWTPQVPTGQAELKIRVTNPSGLNLNGTDYEYDSTTELRYTSGLESQNNSLPQGIFIDGHVFARILYADHQRWLDASYGVEYVGASSAARVEEFERTSLYGLGQPGVGFFGYFVKKQTAGQPDLIWTF